MGGVVYTRYYMAVVVMTIYVLASLKCRGGALRVFTDQTDIGERRGGFWHVGACHL